MPDPAKEALSIYETICATSNDRPFAFLSAADMYRDLGAWQESNPGLVKLANASPDVQTAFLRQSVEWLRAESRERDNFCVLSTLMEATAHALEAAPKPLPQDLVLALLTDLREDLATRIYFPFEKLLGVLTRDQVTEEMRVELRKLHLQYAPSPTGKIEESTLKVRNRLAELMYVEGEKQLDAGRGPWSQIVFDEIAVKDEITRAGWEALLEHFRTLEQAVPGAKWKKRANELASALGQSEVQQTVERWLALGPTPEQPAEARPPIEDSAYQKGAVWFLASSRRPELASVIGDFGVACLRKIPMIGAVSQKVGFACVQALGTMECNEAIAQLTRMRTRVKYSVALRLIEKCLRQAAERSGLTVDEIEDFAVASYSLDLEGRTEISIGDAKAALAIQPDGRVAVMWRNADGKLVKSAPAPIRKAFPKEVKAVSALAKELEQAYAAQRLRLESAFLGQRTVSLEHWRRYFIEHPLLGLLGRRLIWIFGNDQGWEQSGIYRSNEVHGASGEVVDVAAATKVRLWHPLSSHPAELQQWREYVFQSTVRQPFRQAFREFYEVTDEERKSKTYSNRFAGMLMRQHQFASLCRARGWSYRLMGTGFDGYNVPTKQIAPWNMQAQFYVDLPSDRKPSLQESALAEQTGSGINLFLGSDQVRFYRDQKEVPVDEVPAVVYSEVMRDVDLFVSVSGIGQDESWSDQGDRGAGVVDSIDNSSLLDSVVALRIEILSRILPLTPIAAQCEIQRIWLVVRGKLGTYQIGISWGRVTRIADSQARQINIPAELLEKVEIDPASFPIELDHRTEMILRKAYLLANDWEITSPELIAQL